jgi:hypothetical protein
MWSLSYIKAMNSRAAANAIPGWRVAFHPEWSRKKPWKLFNSAGGMVGSYRSKREANREIPMQEVKM